MAFYQIVTSAGIVSLMSLLVCFLPLGPAVAYLIHPTEDRLALMRPVSLAGIFSGLCGTVLGFINVLRSIGMREPTPAARILAIGAAESLVPIFVAFGCLTVAWLCVAAGMRRRAA